MLSKDIEFRNPTFFNYKPDWRKNMTLSPIWTTNATTTYNKKSQKTGRRSRQKWDYSYSVSYRELEDYTQNYLVNLRATNRQCVVPIWILHTTGTLSAAGDSISFNAPIEINHFFPNDYLLISDGLVETNNYEVFAFISYVDRIGLTVYLENVLSTLPDEFDVHVIPCLTGIYNQGSTSFQRKSIDNYSSIARFVSL